MQLDLIERLLCGVHEDVEQIALESHHDGLRFGVAHAAIEFERLGVALRVDHQAGIQEAGERNAVFRHARQRGQDDLLHRLGMHVGRDHRSRRVGAHATGVGAGVAVEQALVVLAGGQREHVLAVGQHDEAGFFALQKLFDHDARAAFVVLHAELVVLQHPVDGFVGLGQRHGHDHALARCQAIGLDHDGRADLVDVGMRRRRVGEGDVERRRDAVALHEVLGEGLGALELRGRLGRAEDAQAARAEFVDHPGRQRSLGADHGERDLLGLREVGQRLHVGHRHVDQAVVERGAAVAGSHVDLLHTG